MRSYFKKNIRTVSVILCRKDVPSGTLLISGIECVKMVFGGRRKA